MISRCQRFDLSRVKSEELFKFIKEIKEKEKGKISEDAIKLIVKISEGSVRDALSLLDRVLLSQEQNEEIDLKKAQSIFGYFDKSYLIDLIKYLFEGKEDEVIKIYRTIYDKGVEPKVFLNDFLELLYYFKNISSIKLESTHFSLNDEDFNKIKILSKDFSQQTLLLFWQFAIKAIDELEIVSNQNLSVEMFLIRLMYLIDIPKKNIEKKYEKDDLDSPAINNLQEQKTQQNDINFDIKNKTISQIKNVHQREIGNIETKTKQQETLIEINSFEKLIDICNKRKEIKLKYELETKLNLVSFEQKRIEISFNENLDKDFVKNLSTKLFDWTNDRWIITFSQTIGTPTKKQANQINKSKLFLSVKDSIDYKKITKIFPDLELIDVEILNKND